MMKTYQIVAEFESESEPNRKYTVKVDEMGNLSCNCPAWIYKAGGVRHCKHIEMVKQRGLVKEEKISLKEKAERLTEASKRAFDERAKKARSEGYRYAHWNIDYTNLLRIWEWEYASKCDGKKVLSYRFYYVSDGRIFNRQQYFLFVRYREDYLRKEFERIKQRIKEVLDSNEEQFKNPQYHTWGSQPYWISKEEMLKLLWDELMNFFQIVYFNENGEINEYLSEDFRNEVNKYCLGIKPRIKEFVKEVL